MVTYAAFFDIMVLFGYSRCLQICADKPIAITIVFSCCKFLYAPTSFAQLFQLDVLFCSICERSRKRAELMVNTVARFKITFHLL